MTRIALVLAALMAAANAGAAPLDEIQGDYTVLSDAGVAVGTGSISADGTVRLNALTFQCHPDPARKALLYEDGTVAFTWKETESGLVLTAMSDGRAAQVYDLVVSEPTPYQSICGISYSIVKDPSDQSTVIGWLYLLKPATPTGATTIKVNTEHPVWVQPEGYKRELVDRDGKVLFRWVDRPFGIVMSRIRNGKVVARYNLVHIVYADPDGGLDIEPQAIPEPPR